MKNGQRKVHVEKEVTVKTVEGEDVTFSPEEKFSAVVVNRKEGICEVESKGQFRCKKIKGISHLA